MLGLWILDGIRGLKALALVEIFHGGEEEDLGFLSQSHAAQLQFGGERLQRRKLASSDATMEKASIDSFFF